LKNYNKLNNNTNNDIDNKLKDEINIK